MSETKVWISSKKLKSGKRSYYLRWIDHTSGKWKNKAAGSDRKRVERHMGPLPRSESVREAEEVHLVDGVEHFGHGPLDNLVFQNRHTDGPRAPIRLGEMHPTYGLRPIAPRVHPFAQILELPLQGELVARNRLPIDPRAGAPLLTTESPSQGVFIDVVQERREPATPVSLRNLVHSLERRRQDSPALRPDLGLLQRVPFKPTPSLHRLRG